MTAADTTDQPSWVWWETRRLHYNLGLIAAGALGLAIEATAVVLWAPAAPDWLWLILFQGLIYLLYMLGANLLYLLGAAVEGVLRPAPVATYRTTAFALGCAAAWGLPVVAALFLFTALGWGANVG